MIIKCKHEHFFVAVVLIGLLVYFGSHRQNQIKQVKPSRAPKAVLVPQPITVESASAGRPYQIFQETKGRKPKNRYEYKRWLKVNFTTDWEYWYDRYREYREYTDGYAPGSGFFTHKKHTGIN